MSSSSSSSSSAAPAPAAPGKSSLQLLDDIIAELEAAVQVEKPVDPKPSGKKDKKDESAKASSLSSSDATAISGGGGGGGAAAPSSTTTSTTAPAAEKAALNVNSIDLRVGLITSVKRHETADKLYCEMIDVGEAEPRAIASGLVPHYTLEQMQSRMCIVICNLKPRKLVGFASNGMVLCAVKKDEAGNEKVEFVDIPAGSKPGDRIVGEGLAVGEVLTPNQVEKQKAFETVGAGFTVNSRGEAMWNDVRLIVQSSGAVCTAPTVRDGIMR